MFEYKNINQTVEQPSSNNYPSLKLFTSDQFLHFSTKCQEISLRNGTQQNEFDFGLFDDANEIVQQNMDLFGQLPYQNDIIQLPTDIYTQIPIDYQRSQNVKKQVPQTRSLKENKAKQAEEDVQIFMGIVFDKLHEFFSNLLPDFHVDSFKDILVYRNTYLQTTQTKIKLNWKNIADELSNKSSSKFDYNERQAFNMFTSMQNKYLDQWTRDEIGQIRDYMKELYFTEQIKDKREIKQRLEQKFLFSQAHNKNMKQLLDMIDNTYKSMTK